MKLYSRIFLNNKLFVPILGITLLTIGSVSFKYTVVRACCLGVSSLLILLFLRSIGIPKSIKSYTFWFLIYLSICFLSIIWSVDLYKSLGKIIELTVGFLWVLVVNSYGRIELCNLYRYIVSICLGIIGVSLFLYLGGDSGYVYPYYRSFLGFEAIDNPFLGKNGLGLIAVLVFLFHYYDNKLPPIYKFLILVICGFVILLAYSRTSFVSIIIAFVVVGFEDKRKLILVSIIFAAIIALSYNSIIEIFLRGQNTDNFLSGRPEIWSVAWNEYLNSPILGYGYGVGSGYATRFIFFRPGEAASTAHNGLLEVLLGVGLTGSIVLVPLFLFITITIFRKIQSNINRNLYVGYIVLFSSSIMNTGIAGWYSIPMLLFFINICLIDRDKFYENNFYCRYR